MKLKIKVCQNTEHKKILGVKDNMGAFINDVIILGVGGGLEKMTKDDGGCWAKDDVTFLI